jgi:hypothetical protein
MGINSKFNHFYSFFLVAAAYLCLPLSSSLGIAQAPGKKTNLTTNDRVAWYEILKWPKKCEEAFRQTSPLEQGFAGVEFYSLGRGEYIVEVVCYSGAYQPGSIFMYYDERRPLSARALKLKGFETEDEPGKVLEYSEINGLTKFNRKRKELEILSKYRGAGDCGKFVRYKIERGEAEVIEAREQECDDNRIGRDIDPRRWPRKRLK